MGIPAPTEVNDTCPQHILKVQNGPLALAVSLRMKCRAKVHPRAQFLVELFPEAGGKSNISVRNNGDRNPVSSDNLMNIHIGQLLRR